MLEIISRGGFMMYPILLSSMIGLAIILERAYVFFSNPFPCDREMQELFTLLQEGKLEEARDKTATWKGFMSNLAITIIHKHENPEDAASRATSLGEKALFILGERLEVLSSLGTVVPLMGLLGTVFGMINVFSRVASAGDAANITVLADGIWQALITTAAGMSIAIPILLAYYFFTRKIDTMAFRIEQTSQELIHELQQVAHGD